MKEIENLDEEARLGAEMDILFDEIELSEHEMIFEDTFHKICKHFYIFGKQAGAEWMAGQGVTKEAVIGMATEKIIINVSLQTLDELDLCPGDKVVVQIRKK